MIKAQKKKRKERTTNHLKCHKDGAKLFTAVEPYADGVIWHKFFNQFNGETFTNAGHYDEFLKSN